MILALFLLAVSKPTEPLKPWTPDMCEVRQKYATGEYLEYCRVNSPNKHPNCPAVTLKQPHKKGDRFEYWDCSWHPAHAPRK